MIYLLDTHVFIWWDINPSILSSHVSDILKNGDSRIYVSAVTNWEISIKRKIGKLNYSQSPSEAIAAYGFEPISISGEHGEFAGGLPMHHNDPFDRLLIAQAIRRHLTLISSDQIFMAYPVPLIPAR